MKSLKAFWNFLSGKKSKIALCYWSIVTPSIMILWPVQVPTGVSKTHAICGLILTAVGLGHSAIKAYSKPAEVAEPVLPDKIEPIDSPK